MDAPPARETAALGEAVDVSRAAEERVVDRVEAPPAEVAGPETAGGVPLMLSIAGAVLGVSLIANLVVLVVAAVH